MTLDELKERLKAEKIPNGWYFLEQIGNNDDKTCLEFSEGKWLVYYSERGEKLEFSSFETEAEACGELLSRMLSEKQRYKS